MTLLAAAMTGLALWLVFPSQPINVRHPPWRSLAVTGSGVAGWGVVTGGLPVRIVVWGVIGLGVGAGGWLIWQRRRERRAREATGLAVLEACEIIAAELAAGRPPGHALAEAATRWPGLLPAVEAWSLGSDVPGALRRLSALPGAGDLRVVGAAWQVAHHSGHGLAQAVARVAARIRAQRQTQRVVASELASARATARLVAALPVVALMMGSGAGGDPWHFLSGTAVGLGCLAAGISFALAGLWWIEALADRVDPR